MGRSIASCNPHLLLVYALVSRYEHTSNHLVNTMQRWERNLNGLQAIIIACVLFGALSIQYFYDEEPCVLCLMQRLGMLGVAAGALMNCRFGPRRAHYGFSLLSAIYGGFVALRQIALHICPQFPTFGIPFWGLSLYMWSFIIFSCSVAFAALLLICFDSVKREVNFRMNWWSQLAFALIFLAAFANIFSTLQLCGLGPCS